MIWFCNYGFESSFMAPDYLIFTPKNKEGVFRDGRQWRPILYFLAAVEDHFCKDWLQRKAKKGD